jgi:hypothetical protein
MAPQATPARRREQNDKRTRGTPMRQLTRWSWLGTLVMALGMVVVACGAPQPSAQQSPTVAAEPAATPVPEVVITAKEYSFAGPESIAGGWTKVTLDNQGAKSHDLVLFRLDDGKTMDDVMAALESEGPPPDWISIFGQSSADAGKRTMFIANLVPGKYAMISFGDEEDGPPDAAKGMVKSMAVTDAPAAPVALPKADATIDMGDFSYSVSGLRAGKQLIQANNKGAEDHEAVMFRINEGKTFADVQALLKLPEEQQGQQYADVISEAGGLSVAAGQTVYVEQELAPGSYALVCFLPSARNEGKPHAELGMVQEVVVK